MYTRSPQGRFPRDLRVPRNYAGNAFRPPLSEKESETPIFIDADIDEYETKEESSAPISETGSEETTEKTAEISEKKSEAKQTGLFSFPKFDLGLGKLFSKGGINIGFEELLILGVILLIASEGKGDDLILLLILLLFIQ